MKYKAIICIFALLLSACSDNKQYETAICALADISGTYANEKQSVTRIIKAGILPALVPGDSLFFITIDSNSFNEEDLKAKLTLDYSPSKANAQKLAFANSLDEFAKGDERSKYTDISGAMMLCGDYLKSTEAGTQAMFIFSDMKEELEKGVKRNFREDEFPNMHIAAMNVIKLAKDSSDPEVFRKRLGAWEEKVANSGASGWHVILDPAKIPEYITDIK